MHRGRAPGWRPPPARERSACFGHTLIATLGLGAILRASDWLFLALKLAGAAYLIYLGVTLLRTKQDLVLGHGGQRSHGRLFLEGAVSNLSNAKIVVFYLAFLPQFVAPSAGHPTLTVFALGATFAALTFLVKGPVGIFAGALSARSAPAGGATKIMQKADAHAGLSWQQESLRASQSTASGSSCISAICSRSSRIRSCQ